MSTADRDKPSCSKDSSVRSPIPRDISLEEFLKEQHAALFNAKVPINLILVSNRMIDRQTAFTEYSMFARFVMKPPNDADFEIFLIPVFLHLFWLLLVHKNHYEARSFIKDFRYLSFVPELFENLLQCRNYKEIEELILGPGKIKVSLSTRAYKTLMSFLMETFDSYRANQGMFLILRVLKENFIVIRYEEEEYTPVLNKILKAEKEWSANRVALMSEKRAKHNVSTESRKTSDVGDNHEASKAQQRSATDLLFETSETSEDGDNGFETSGAQEISESNVPTGTREVLEMFDEDFLENVKGSELSIKEMIAALKAPYQPNAPDSLAKRFVRKVRKSDYIVDDMLYALEYPLDENALIAIVEKYKPIKPKKKSEPDASTKTSKAAEEDSHESLEAQKRSEPDFSTETSKTTEIGDSIPKELSFDETVLPPKMVDTIIKDIYDDDFLQSSKSDDFFPENCDDKIQQSPKSVVTESIIGDIRDDGLVQSSKRVGTLRENLFDDAFLQSSKNLEIMPENIFEDETVSSPMSAEIMPENIPEDEIVPSVKSVDNNSTQKTSEDETESSPDKPYDNFTLMPSEKIEKSPKKVDSEECHTSCSSFDKLLNALLQSSNLMISESAKAIVEKVKRSELSDCEKIEALRNQPDPDAPVNLGSEGNHEPGSIYYLLLKGYYKGKKFKLHRSAKRHMERVKNSGLSMDEMEEALLNPPDPNDAVDLENAGDQEVENEADLDVIFKMDDYENRGLKNVAAENMNSENEDQAARIDIVDQTMSHENYEEEIHEPELGVMNDVTTGDKENDKKIKTNFYKFKSMYHSNFHSAYPITISGKDVVCCSDISPDFHYLAIGFESCKICVWEMRDTDLKLKPIGTLRGHTAIIYSLAIDSIKKTIISGSHDCTVRIWDIVAGLCITQIKEHSAPVYDVCLSSDHNYFLTASKDSVICLFNYDRKRPVKVYRAHSEEKEPINCIRFHPNCLYFACACSDGNVFLYQININIRPVRMFHRHKTEVFALSFAPTGKTLASADIHGILIIWDILMQIPIRVIETKLGIRSISFDQSGCFIAAIFYYSSWKIYNILGSEKKMVIEAKCAGAVKSLRFSKDNKLFIVQYVEASKSEISETKKKPKTTVRSVH